MHGRWKLLKLVKFLLSILHFNPLNAELNPIYHLLALLGGATIVVVSRLRVNSNLHKDHKTFIFVSDTVRQNYKKET